jgi:S-DNA-T family DNA segregation ATPase FtsK/SpoIIIE
MIMVDPKRVELSLFEGIPHLVDIKLPGGKKIITDPKAATLALKTVSEIMDRRYEDFVALKVRNIKEFNDKADEPIPYIIVVIDELADLMMVSSSTVEQYICRIAQLGRASGIHLIVATQRPSVDVITGLIKANIPSRIAFAVSSNVDSRTILDRAGAEKLLGKGDMLYLPVDASEPRRIQGAYVSGEEIENVVEFWKQQPPPENTIPIELEMETRKDSEDNDGEDDALLQEAIEIIKMTRQASVSNLQRKMKIGYARAGRMMDQLEKKGIVGPADGSKPRKIMLPGFTDME